MGDSLPFGPPSAPAHVGRSGRGAGPSAGRGFYGSEYFTGGGGGYDSRPTGSVAFGGSVRPMQDNEILRSMLAVPISSAATTKVQFESNGFVHYAKRLRDSSKLSPTMDTFRGMCVFSFRDKDTTSPTGVVAEDVYNRTTWDLRPDTVSSVADQRAAAMLSKRTYGGTYVMLSLPQLNFMLASTEIARFHSVDKDVILCKTATDVLDDWTYEGIGVTDRPVDVAGKDYDQRVEGIVNFNIHGRHSAVHQVWGNGLPSQNNCFLIIKRLNHADDYPAAYKISTKGLPMRPKAPKGKTLVDRPLVVIPWAKPYQERPGFSDLVYRDLDGTLKTGIALFVGRIRDPGPHVNENRRGRAWKDLSAYLGVPKTEFFLAHDGRKCYNEAIGKQKLDLNLRPMRKLEA